MSLFKFIAKLINPDYLSFDTKRMLKREVKKAKRALNSDFYFKKDIVITLDSVLNKVLSDLYGSNSISFNLKKYRKRFNLKEYNDIWKAHRLRNKLVHEPDFKPTSRKLDRAIRYYLNYFKKYV